ncbi:MAG: DUF551 domain-containing protein [Pyrinomonadaceae bacterium]
MSADSATTDGWLRVVSDQPKLGERVLVWDRNRREAVVAERAEEFFWEQTTEGTGWALKNVSWWMPLPGPPAGERE